ncbi:hypothetical protein, partial [Nonomuraea helvata]
MRGHETLRRDVAAWALRGRRRVIWVIADQVITASLFWGSRSWSRMLRRARSTHDRLRSTTLRLVLWNLFCQAALIGRGQLGAGSPSRMTLLTTGSKPR